MRAGGHQIVATMDSLVAEILSFPPSSKVSDHEYDKQARALVQRLEGIATANLTGKSPDGQTLLEVGCFTSQIGDNEI